MKSYNDIYLDARKALRLADIGEYTTEARLICAVAAGKTKEEFVRDLAMYPNAEYAKSVAEMVSRRIMGEPLAYVTGEWEFFGLPMIVSRDVLIPRVDTEVLAEKAIELLKEMPKRRVLDLCSGTGCIGIAIAANVPDAKVVLVDKSAAAMRIARRNVEKNGVSRITTCVNCDALSSPPMLLGAFDMIVSNPPYIPTEDIISLDPSVRDNEPNEALDGGDDGLTFYRNIASKWKSIIKKGGKLLVEVGIGQAGEVAEMLEDAGFEDVNIIRDTMDIERVVYGTMNEDNLVSAETQDI